MCIINGLIIYNFSVSVLLTKSKLPLFLRSIELEKTNGRLTGILEEESKILVLSHPKKLK